MEAATIYILFIAGLGIGGEPVADVTGPFRTHQACQKELQRLDFILHDKMQSRTLRCQPLEKPRGVLHPEYRDGGPPVQLLPVAPVPRKVHT